MRSLSELLTKYRDLFSKGDSKKKTVAKILSDEIGVEVNAEDITIRSGVIHLSVHPAVRNEIFLKKAKLLEKIKEQETEFYPKDIR